MRLRPIFALSLALAALGVPAGAAAAQYTLPVDGDGDGSFLPADCNDADPTVHPGATEIYYDGIDQDCVSGTGTYAPVPAKLTHRWVVRGAWSRAAVLRLNGVRLGSKVVVSCRGRRCPIRSRTAKPGADGRLDLRRLLRRRPLRAGSRLTIRVSAPKHESKVTTFRFRRGRRPLGGVFGCLAPGSTQPHFCFIAD